MESTAEPTTDVAKRVFNERQFTQFSKERLSEFEDTIETSLPTVKDILGAKQVGAFVFGSAAIGVATDAIPVGETTVDRSDVDAFFVYEGQHPSLINTLDNLTRVVQTHDGQLQDLLLPQCPDISVRGAIPVEAIKNVLDTMKNGNIASYADQNPSRFFLHILTNILLTKHAGDAAFIKDLKKNIVQQLQNFGEPGEKIWEQMNTIFKEEYVRYGDVAEFHPARRKRQIRLNAATDQILTQRGIPLQAKPIAQSIMNVQKETISLPPLSEAESLLH